MVLHCPNDHDWLRCYIGACCGAMATGGTQSLRYSSICSQRWRRRSDTVAMADPAGASDATTSTGAGESPAAAANADTAASLRLLPAPAMETGGRAAPAAAATGGAAAASSELPGSGGGYTATSTALPPPNVLETATAKDYYVDSYGHHAIHEEMLKDRVRTLTYRDAILRCRDRFHGKVVLDVGCGTGILSMFAAQAGARRVFAVDCSGIVAQTRQIVAANGFADVVEVIDGKIEEVELPVDKVDIIVSEWMGYFLLYESMLDSVIFARDKWLAPGGLLLPDKATMYLNAIEDAEYRSEKIDFWDDVYGFDMSCIKKMALLEPLVEEVFPKHTCSDTVPFHTIDLATVTLEDLKFRVPFKLQFQRSDFCHALVSYFDVEFSAVPGGLTLSTSPRRTQTHWKQVVFYLLDTFPVAEGDVLRGHVACGPNKRNKRDLDIEIEYAFEGQHCVLGRTQRYRLR